VPHTSYHSNQNSEIWVSCDNATQQINLELVDAAHSKRGRFIRYTTWPLGPHRFLNNKDGSKTWLSDDNTKEKGIKRLQERKTIEALHTSHS
jgi:hypothetical protein